MPIRRAGDDPDMGGCAAHSTACANVRGDDAQPSSSCGSCRHSCSSSSGPISQPTAYPHAAVRLHRLPEDVAADLSFDHELGQGQGPKMGQNPHRTEQREAPGENGAGGSHLCAPALQRSSAPCPAQQRTSAHARQAPRTTHGSRKQPTTSTAPLRLASRSMAPASTRPDGDRPRPTASRLGLALPCRMVEQRCTLVDDVHGEQLQRRLAHHRESGMPDPALVQYRCSSG